MTEIQRRRFITRNDVDDAKAAGRPVVVRGRDVLTDEAAQRALDLGVAVQREGAAPSGAPTAKPAAAASPAPATAPAASAGSASGGSEEQLRKAVRAAVVAELGREPAGLDGAIDAVLRRRG